MSIKSILVFGLVALGTSVALTLAVASTLLLVPVVVALTGLVAGAYLSPSRFRFLSNSPISRQILPAALRTSPTRTALAVFAVGVPLVAGAAGMNGIDEDGADLTEPEEVAVAATIEPTPTATVAATATPTETGSTVEQVASTEVTPTRQPTSTPIPIEPTPTVDLAASGAIAAYWNEVNGQVTRVKAAHDHVQSLAPADVLADTAMQEQIYPSFDELIAVYDEALAMDDVPEGFFASWHEDYLDVLSEFDDAAHGYDRVIGTNELGDAERALAQMADARVALDDLLRMIQYK